MDRGGKGGEAARAFFSGATKSEREQKEEREEARLYLEKGGERSRCWGVLSDPVFQALESIVFARPVVAIDLSYARRMRDKELPSVAVQVAQCYGRNRRAARERKERERGEKSAEERDEKSAEEEEKSGEEKSAAVEVASLVSSVASSSSSLLPLSALPFPLELHLVGESCLRDVFAKHEGYDNWKIFRHPEKNSVEECFPREKIVVLSPESSNVLLELDRDKVYVIGGEDFFFFLFRIFFCSSKKKQKEFRTIRMS